MATKTVTVAAPGKPTEMGYTMLVALTNDPEWVKRELQSGKTPEMVHALYLQQVEKGRAMAAVQPNTIAENETPAQTIARLQAENAALKANGGKTLGKVTMKFSVQGVNEKTGHETKGGSLCIYGLQRFPYSFYLSAFERLFGSLDDDTDMGMVKELKAFAKANRSKFALKTSA